MAARYLLCFGSVFVMPGCRQRSQAGEDAQHVTALRFFLKIPARCLKDKVNLLVEGPGFKYELLHGNISGADDNAVVPWHAEQHPAITGLWNHDCVITSEKTPVNNKVNTLARSHHRLLFRVVHPDYAVDKDAGGIDNAFPLGGELGAVKLIHGHHS